MTRAGSGRGLRTARKRAGWATAVASISTATALAAALVATATGARAEQSAEDAAAPAGPLAAEMSQLLELQPGGVQLSDNAMAWDGGSVIVVWPSLGESAAPSGLGDNVRDDVVPALGIDPAVDERSSAETTFGSPSTCPVGYYCFYTNNNFDGVRYQFSSSICAGNPSAWGFNNLTSSWANRTGAKIIRALDYNGGPLLWTMRAGYSSSYVGAADDNKMGFWTCG